MKLTAAQRPALDRLLEYAGPKNDLTLDASGGLIDVEIDGDEFAITDDGKIIYYPPAGIPASDEDSILWWAPEPHWSEKFVRDLEAA